MRSVTARAVTVRRAHDPKVAGSDPAPAAIEATADAPGHELGALCIPGVQASLRGPDALNGAPATSDDRCSSGVARVVVGVTVNPKVLGFKPPLPGEGVHACYNKSAFAEVREMCAGPSRDEVARRVGR